MDEELQLHRQSLKSHPLWKNRGDVDTPAKRGVPRPEVQKPCPPEAMMVDLVARDSLSLGQMSLLDALKRRQTRRSHNSEPLTLEELSFLLWAAQGVNREANEAGIARRTAPSGDSLYPIETYVIVKQGRVDGVSAGLYRYLPLDHKLCVLSTGADCWDRVMACLNSKWADKSSVMFIWSAIPSRFEWTFSILCHKAIVMEAAHSCQNVYLACEAIGAGTAGVGAYFQKEIDAAIGLDGTEEFVVYFAPIGKVSPS